MTFQNVGPGHGHEGCDPGDGEFVFDDEGADDTFDFGGVSTPPVSTVEYRPYQCVGAGNEFFCLGIHIKAEFSGYLLSLQ